MAVAVAFVRLRWRLLRGSIRHGGAEQVGAIVSTVASGLIGGGVGAAILIAARTTATPRELAVIFCTSVLIAAVGFGIVAGIAQPIDPRVIAAEPLTDRERAAGLLASSALGPAGLAGVVLGGGVVAGFTNGTSTAPVVVAAVASWLFALLLIARTATNLLALFAARYQRLGQVVVGLAGLLFYGTFQFVPALLGGLDVGHRERVADTMRWSPPGQLGEALAAADRAGGLWHLAAGSVWLPVLVWAFARSSARLAVTARAAGGTISADAERTLLGRFARRLCGRDPAGALAWRSILTRFRTPRTALETVIGAGVGLAAVLVPTLLRDTPGSGAVLVGGAVQLAVLFMAGNSFGIDGPAITHELLTGLDARTLVAGKARGIVIVAAPLAVIGPLLAAAITGEWRYVVAGFGVGVGGLLAGTGAALVQSAVVPIAIPESDNPFAGGESGKGIVAALLLGVVLAGLAVATVPVALALFWATERGEADLVTLFGAATVVAGWLVLRAGRALATRRLAGRDPEFVAAVTPAR